ncbi:MAG: glycoside hydrolase family 18 protein, partial [Alteromonadales bacterium]|nr:glycoside hydrolase family 18 protein [Alteromonadales bacterium]
EHYSEVANNPQKRAHFAQSIVAFIKRYQFNGVEINWHNTALHQQGKSWSIADKTAFTLLLKSIREAFDKQPESYLLSTSPALSKQDIYSWQVKEVYQLVDFLNLRTEQQIPYNSPTSGFLSPLFSQLANTNSSVNDTVSLIKEKTNNSSKLVITIPSFALAFEGVKKSASLAIVNQPVKTASRGSWDVSEVHTGLYSRRHLKQYLDNPEYLHFWDEITQSAYLYSAMNNGGHFISFEDKQSIDAKVNYVNEHQLAGIAISQLHSDNETNKTVLAMVYASFHPWLALKNRLIDHYQHYKNLVYLFSSILMLIIVLLSIFKIKSKQALKEQLQAESEFKTLQENLQQLNVPLEESLRLIQAMPKHILASLPKDSAAKATLSFIHKMAMINQQLLQETKLGDGLRAPSINSFVVNDLVQNVLETFQCNNEKRVLSLAQKTEQIMFNGDELYLQQILLMVLNLVWQRNDQSQPILLSFDIAEDDLVLEISESDAEQSMLVLSDLMAARKLVNHLNGRFIVEYTPSLSIRIIIANGKVITQQDARQIEQVKHSDYLNVIANFASDSMQMTNVEQLIEHAVFLLNHKQEEEKVAVLHGEKGVLFNQKAKPGEYYEVAKLLDYSFVVFDEKDNSGQLATCIHALVGQINMVRQQVHQLASTPRLLSELYDISSNKEKIDYIKAEKGYSGLYIKGKKEPLYV